MICICIIGIIETVFFIELTFITKFYSIFFHLLLLVPIFYNKIFKYSKNIKKKSCIQKNNSYKKQKTVTFSKNNEKYYKNDIRYFLEFNIKNLIIFIISILIILYLPYWPYIMTRTIMLIFFIIIYLSCWLYPIL